jgi:hypothetical protein
MRDDRGLSSLELGLVLPIVMLVLTVTVPVVQAGWSYLQLSRATAAGIRYATRADENARPSPSGTLTRRPTPDEVGAFVREAAGPLSIGSIDVSPDPSGSLPGETITVAVTHEVSLGPLAAAANGLTSVFFGGGRLLPESKVITVSARGREE